MKKIILLTFITFVCYVSFKTSLFAEENLLTIKQQLDRMQREVNDLSKQVFKQSNNDNEAFQNNDSNQTLNFSSIDIRIYDLEKDIKSLTMSIEELVFTFDELNEKILTIQEEFNTKFNNISSTKTNQNNNVLEKQTNIVNENSKNTLGTLNITMDSNQKENIDSIENLETKNNNEIESLNKLSPDAQFQFAFEQIRNKEYEESKFSLQNFINQNPKNQLSGSAHYWLGELFLLEKNSREAALILAEGYQKFPKSIKAPNMLYKLSQALVEIGKNQEACNTLNKLIKDFANNKLMKKAEKKKIEISCDVLSE